MECYAMVIRYEAFRVTPTRARPGAYTIPTATYLNTFLDKHSF
jgi:hypothetical protein